MNCIVCELYLIKTLKTSVGLGTYCHLLTLILDKFLSDSALVCICVKGDRMGKRIVLYLRHGVVKITGANVDNTVLHMVLET